jgi:hypothetical protein
MGLVPCIAVSTGYIQLVLFLALLLLNTIMYVQDGAGALNFGVHGLHPPGALTGPLVIEYDNVCAGWGWCPVLQCPRATSCWCSSWLSCY